MLLRFAREVAHRPVEALRFEDLTPELIGRFLQGPLPVAQSVMIPTNVVALALRPEVAGCDPLWAEAHVGREFIDLGGE